MIAGYGSGPAAPAFGPKFTRLSKLVSALLAVLCALTLIYPGLRAYVTLVPGRTLPFVWNLLTAPFVTTNPIKALLEVVALLLLARIIEPIYGSTEFLRLLLIVAVAGSTATFLGAYLFYLTSPYKDGAVLYTEFSGFHGVIGGLLVAVKQIMADQEIKLAGVLSLPARYLPSLYVIGAALVATALKAWTALAFLVLCPYISWVYLRFFQLQPETTLRGDPSEEFKFSSFFPDAVAAPIDAAARVCGIIFCLRHSPEAVAASSGGIPLEELPLVPRGVGGGVPLPGDSSEASRRRERGAKALEERLKGVGGAGKGAGAAGGLGDAADRMEAGNT